MGRKKSSNNYKSVFSKRLNDEYEKRRNNDAKYTQKEFAFTLGIEKTLLNKLMSEEREPTLDVLYKVSNALSCNVEWLIRDDVQRDRYPIDEDISILQISKKTGLTSKAIRCLIEDYDKNEMIALNELISNLFSISFLKTFYRLLNIEDEEEDIVYDETIIINLRSIVLEQCKVCLSSIVQYSDCNMERIRKRLKMNKKALSKIKDKDSYEYRIIDKQICYDEEQLEEYCFYSKHTDCNIKGKVK